MFYIPPILKMFIKYVKKGIRTLKSFILLQLASLEMKLFVFRELISLGCINLKNICAHHKEEILRINKMKRYSSNFH